MMIKQKNMLTLNNLPEIGIAEQIVNDDNDARWEERVHDETV